MIKKRIKTLLLFAVLSLFSSNLFAVEEYIANIYKQIDTIFVSKSEEALNTVLQDNQNDKYYYLIEGYTEKKIRRLIVNDDYEFAMTAIVIVIEHNLDNEQAVEMYSSIADAYQVQQDYEIKQEQQRQLELARLEKEKEKQKVVVAKEYVPATQTASGSVYIAGKETSLTSYTWKGQLAIVDFSILNEASKDLTALNYGINLNFMYEYLGENANVGFDALAEFKFLPLGKTETQIPLMMDLDIGPKLAFKGLNKDLFIKAGFAAICNETSGKALTGNVTREFFTPYVGLEVERLALGPVLVNAGAEYYAAHIWTKDINFAAGANLNASIPFAETEIFKLSFNIGVNDKFYYKTSGIENKASVILAIGAENVSK